MSPLDPWPAPQANAPVEATIAVPGSKSLTNRYLLLAALASGPSLIHRPLAARDSDLMRAALESLGAQIEPVRPDADDGNSRINPSPTDAANPRINPGTAGAANPRINPGSDGAAAAPINPAADAASPVPDYISPVPDDVASLRVSPGPVRGGGQIECGLAGTVMRFLLPVAGLADGPVTFDGDPAARARPLAGLLDALRHMGITIDDDGRGALPLTVHGRGHLTGGTVTIDASASSQFLSALLLIGPRCNTGLTVVHRGARLPSRPHIEMTLACLRRFGATVETGATVHADATGDADAPDTWHVAPGGLTGQTVTVEPDLSNAGPFLAAAVVTGGHVRLAGWPEQTTQAGALLRHYLNAYGAAVTWSDGHLDVIGPDVIDGVDLDLTDAGELVPTLAAIALFATSPTRLRGIGHLRGHETDRLAALTSEIGRLGGQARLLPDGLEIVPTRLHGATLDSYGDHRMATFGAIVGLRTPGVGVRDIATTGKTLPDFAARWEDLAREAA